MDTLNETLLRQFHQIASLMMRSRGPMGAGLPRDMDMGRGQGHLLHILSAKDGMSQKELCELTRIRAASLGELVDKLEQRGLVQRRENEADKRTTNVFLTDKGREFIAQIGAARGDSMDAMFSGLSEEERQQLSTLLDKLAASLHRQDDERDGDGRRFGPMGFGGMRHGFGGHGCEREGHGHDHDHSEPGHDREGVGGPFLGGRPMGGRGRDGRDDNRDFRCSAPQRHSDNLWDDFLFDD